jgi:hypothetical protein
MSTETFNAAVTTVIAALERGYFLSCDPTPLGPSEWARLSCALLAAVSRGYHRQYSTEKESTLDRVRAEVINPDPLPKNPTLFHRLAAIADDVSTHVGANQDGYQDWYLTLKNEFNIKATKATVAEVDEKWLLWKSEQLEMLIHQHENEIAAQARSHGIDYFIATRWRLGLDITRGSSATEATPTPTTGSKRMALGSLPRQGSATPVMRKVPLVSRAASPVTPRRRTNFPHAHTCMESTNFFPPSGPHKAPEGEGKGSTDLDTIAAIIKATLSPAIQAAMALLAEKINMLEHTMAPTQTSKANNHPCYGLTHVC